MGAKWCKEFQVGVLEIEREVVERGEGGRVFEKRMRRRRRDCVYVKKEWVVEREGGFGGGIWGGGGRML